MTGPFKLMSTTLFRSNYDFFDKLDGSGLFLNFNVDDNKNFPDIQNKLFAFLLLPAYQIPEEHHV